MGPGWWSAVEARVYLGTAVPFCSLLSLQDQHPGGRGAGPHCPQMTLGSEVVRPSCGVPRCGVATSLQMCFSRVVQEERETGVAGWGEIASGCAVAPKCRVRSACLLDPLSTKVAPRMAKHMSRAGEGTLELQDWPLQGCRRMGGVCD